MADDNLFDQGQQKTSTPVENIPTPSSGNLFDQGLTGGGSASAPPETQVASAVPVSGNLFDAGLNRPVNGQPPAEAQHIYQDESQPWYRRAWDYANTPLTESLFGLPETREGAGGFERGVEKVASGFTSPLSVALTLATFGAGGAIESAGANALKATGEFAASEIPQIMKASEVAVKALHDLKPLEPVINKALVDSGGEQLLGLVNKAKQATDGMVRIGKFGEEAVQNLLEKKGFTEAERESLAGAAQTASKAEGEFTPIADAVKEAGIDPALWKRGQEALYNNGLTEHDLLGGNFLERGAYQILRKTVPGMSVAAAARIGKSANALLSAGFTLQQFETAAAMSPRFLDALKEGDYDKAWEYGTEAAAGAGFGLLGTSHALHSAGELFKPLLETDKFRPNDQWLALDRAAKERDVQHAVAEQHAVELDKQVRATLGHEPGKQTPQQKIELAQAFNATIKDPGSPEARAWYNALATAANHPDFPTLPEAGGGAAPVGDGPVNGQPLAPEDIPSRANTRVIKENQYGEVRVGSDGRPVVYLSPEAWEKISAREPELSAVAGLSQSPQQAAQLKAKLEDVPLVKDLFETAQQQHATQVLTAAPTAGSSSDMTRVVAEELQHTWQRELSQNGVINKHLNFTQWERLSGILPKEQVADLDANGYSANPIARVAETAAKYRAGIIPDAVSDEDAARWLHAYYKEVEAKHGPQMLDEANKINEVARQHVQELYEKRQAVAARNRTANAGPDQGVGRGVQERPGRPAQLGEAEPPLQVRKLGDEEPRFVDVVHGSRTPGLESISPEFHGKGPQRGAEQARAKNFPDDFVKRSYFRVAGSHGEPFYERQPYQYTARLNEENLYNWEQDPDKLLPKAQAEAASRKIQNQPGAIGTIYERMMKDAGYDGYYHPGSQEVAAFKDTPVEAKMNSEPLLAARDQRHNWKTLQQHLNEDEKKQLDTPDKQQAFVDAFNQMPSRAEWSAAIKAGSAGRLWYERSSKSFDALIDSQPKWFKAGDKDRFLNFVAALSPQQPVSENLRMAVDLWGKWNEAGRPNDVVWKDGKPNKNSSLYRILKGGKTTEGVNLPARMNNAIRAIKGEPLSGPKVSAFAPNLGEDTGRVTNDTWMAVFAGMDPAKISTPHVYNALSAHIREAAAENGIPPRQGQAAVWSFIKSLAELSGQGNERWTPPQEIIRQGLLTPDLVAAHSADFADLLAKDPEIRSRIKALGGDLNGLDKNLKSYVPERPADFQARTKEFTDLLSRPADRLEARRATARGQADIARKSDRFLFDFGFDTSTFSRDRKPNPDVDRLAAEYNSTHGISKIGHVGLAPLDTVLSKQVADAYDAMKHNPDSPETKRAYDALIRETKDQWNAAEKAGYKFEPWTKDGQPYANSEEMSADVRNNKHLYYFPGGDIPADHPLADTDPKTGETYNNMFRAVHDLFGHAKGDYEFGPRGEENAFLAHSRMYSKEAIPALLSETKGQNSWVNFGKHLRDESGNIPAKGEKGYISPTERPYAEQKAGVLPDDLIQKSVNADRRNGPRDLAGLRDKLGQLDKDLAEAQAKLDQHSPKDVEKNTEAYQWDLRTVKNIQDQKAAVQAGVDRLREQGTFGRPVNGLPENIEELVRTNKFKDMPEEYKRLQLQSWRDIATGNVSDKVRKAAGQLRNEDDKNYEIGSANNILHDYIENHMTRMYKDENPAGRVVTSNAKQGKFATNVSMAKHQVYDSHLTALLKSPKEIIMDPAYSVAQGRAALIKAAANRQFIDNLRDNFTRASDGRPAVVLAGAGRVVSGPDGEDPKTFVSPDRLRKLNIADNVVAQLRQNGDLARYLDEGTIKDITPKVHLDNLESTINRLEQRVQNLKDPGRAAQAQADLAELSQARQMAGDPKVQALKAFNDRQTPSYAWDPQDFVSLDHPSMKDWKFATSDPSGNPVFVNSDIKVHPEFADYIKNRLGLEQSSLQKHPVSRALLGAGTKMKETLLSLSPFHMVQIGLRGIMTGTNPFTLEAPDLIHGAKVDPSDPNSPTKMFKMVQQGMTTGTDYKAQQEHSEGVSAGGGIIKHVPIIGKTIANSLNWYQDFLFKKFIPAVKASAAEHMFDKYQAAHPDWSVDRVAKAAGIHANEAFGGINWKAMGRSATTQDWGRLFLLAPDWLESEMRSGARLFNKDEGGIGRAQVAKMAMGLWGIARVMNLLTTGNAHYEAPFGLAVKNKEGKETIFGIRTLPTDLLHAISSPVDFLKGRLSPGIRLGQELLTQRDQFGRKMAPEDLFFDAFRNMSPIPLQSIGQAVSGTGPEIGNTGQVVKALGGTAQTYQTPAQALASKLAADHGEDGPIDPVQMQRHRMVMGLEDKLRAGETTWPELYQLAYQSDQITPEELKKIQTNYKATHGLMDPGTASLYTRASRLPAPQFFQLYDQMNPAEKTALLPLTKQVMRKYVNKMSKDLTPDERAKDATFQRIMRMLPQMETAQPAAQ